MVEKALTISTVIPENSSKIFTCCICELNSKEIIEDGFGNSWSIVCPECGNDSMDVIRPGKAECWICE